MNLDEWRGVSNIGWLAMWGVQGIVTNQVEVTNPKVFYLLMEADPTSRIRNCANVPIMIESHVILQGLNWNVNLNYFTSIKLQFLFPSEMENEPH